MLESMTLTPTVNISNPDLINTSASTTTYTKSKLDTLPLEIKRELFSHLLLGTNLKMTSTSPTHAPPQSTVYRWQKGILTVNHRLGAEAKDYMLNQNRFILLSLPQRPLFAEMMELSRIPIMKKNFGALRRFAAETMRVTVTVYDPLVLSDSSFAQNVHFQQRKYLILAEEFHALEHHLQLCVQTIPQDHVYLTPLERVMDAGQFQVAPLTLTESEIARLNIEFPAHVGVRNDLTVAERIPIQKTLLGPLSGLVSGRQNLHIYGESHAPLESGYINGLSRKSIWGPAVGWRMLESIDKIKVQYESLLGNPNYTKWPVLEDYCSLVGVFFDNNLLREVAEGDDNTPFALRMLDTAPSTTRWLGPVLVEIFDAVITIASTYVTTGLGNDSQSFMNMVDLAVYLCDVYASYLDDGTIIPFSRIDLLYHYYALALVCVEGDFATLRERHEDAASMLERIVPLSPRYMQALADLMVIRSFLDTGVSHLTTYPPLCSLY